MIDQDSRLQGDDLLVYLQWFENVTKLRNAKIPEMLGVEPLEYLETLPQPSTTLITEEPILSHLTIVDSRLTYTSLLKLTGIENREPLTEQAYGSSFPEPEEPY